MSNLNDEYQKIISDIEKNITNTDELKYIKEKISELTVLFINTVDKVIEYSKESLNNMEEKQDELEERIEKLQKSVNNIEEDIYAEDDDFEFEVVCPYCNNEFISDINLEEMTEIQCPECKNIIELDWNEEDEESCKGNCKGCNNCSDKNIDEDM